ncbi:MAG: tol-pal system protein YbgF [Acidiferrobacterales bacterium]|nr:tol-pal system protein YbgF [Acidiferrobacterales bacterium]
MTINRKSICVFGAALCVAPFTIFVPSAVQAQQGTSQSQMLFEMQAMRQEIAELRDMVERQAYQLRQLQNSSSQGAQGPSTNPNVVVNNRPYEQPGDSNVYQIPSSNLPNGSQLPSTSNQLPTQVPGAGAQGSVYTDGSLSNPGYSNQSSPEDSSPYADGSLSANEANPSSTTTDPVNSLPGNYPPVEERVIGSSQASQAPAYDPETYNRPVSQGNSGVSQGTVNTGAPPSTTGSGLPEPYQRQVPARQPIPNNIPSGPSGAAGGGVVTIPQSSSSTAANNPAPQTASTAGLGEQTYYQQGFELLKQSQHDEAVSTFKKQISEYPSGEYADDAHYWIAESLYVNRELDQSKLYFKAIIDKFEQSPRLPDAMLKTAYIEQEQGNNIEARILLQEIIQFHPRSNAAISAKNRLADLN